MRKRLLRAALMIAVSLLTAVGCVLPFWSELFGTWVATFGSDTVTLVFGSTTMTMEAVGSVTGTIVLSLDAVDENAHHADLTATSITGDYVGMLDLDSVWYMTYSFTGEQLYIELSDTDYPATATMGPFTKQ